MFVNWFVSIHDRTTYPPTGEFAGELTFDPEYVSTPFSDSVDYRDGNPRLVSLIRTRGELSIRVNGRTLDRASIGAVDSSAVGSNVTFGGHPSEDGLQFQGVIAEIVYARASPDEADPLEKYLLRKYGNVLVDP